MRDQHLDSHQRLQHISKAIEDIFKYVSNETLNTFCEKEIIHDAVLFQFSIIGEAINFIDPEILEKYNYQWYKVRSFRNLISHEYFNIKMEAVWQIIQKDLPELKIVIKSILKNEFGKQPE
ncbi:MAG: HepT-like ribonuclease domain-containing protein [Bacteroidota bacterium]